MTTELKKNGMGSADIQVSSFDLVIIKRQAKPNAVSQLLPFRELKDS